MRWGWIYKEETQELTHEETALSSNHRGYSQATQASIRLAFGDCSRLSVIPSVPPGDAVIDILAR